MLQKGRKILRMCSYLQEIFKNQCVSYSNKI